MAIDNVKIRSCYTYVIGLSEFGWAMGELAVLLEWAGSVLQEMFAHLSFELLLQGVPSALVTVEVVIVRLLCEMSHDLAWRVVEVLLGLTIVS